MIVLRKQFLLLNNADIKSKIRENAWLAGMAIRGDREIVEPSEELKKLVAVATDLGYPVKLRIEAIESISNSGTHEALLALLGLAANEHLTRRERELAIKLAGKIIKSGY